MQSARCQRPLLRNLAIRLHYARHLGSASSYDQVLTPGDTSILSSQLHSKGYAKTPQPLLTTQACQQVKDRMPKLFRGEFETGIYPDEWHWREGISRTDAAREMCNSWKSDRTIASIVLNEKLGGLIAQVMGWGSVRIAQDDLVWKPPSSTSAVVLESRIDTVGFHQDSAYISAQFEPYENNSVTLWMALDDADEETGCVEYATGSHQWRPILHKKEAREDQQVTALDTDTNETDDNEISSFHSSDETSYRDGLALAGRLADIANPINTIEPAPVREGYAILHNQDTWHGSGPNRSSIRHRRALVAHYVRGDVTFRASAHERSPFGHASYIYGRYKRYNSLDLDESFFPVIHGENRTA
eukprot:CAMPEP_0181082206 /NCGR_PEP_ID=MMETSP1071-20121207/3499_1 /TAXON_ID=35127 /ORGANISM="Thalassiosira sp., Strain NH16" /LENGTH=357 /DNA_ID=CAMNT_0023163779 /DNA_START=110 /DNA_END=1179 /DNA_ORIENTATION=-